MGPNTPPNQHHYQNLTPQILQRNISSGKPAKADMKGDLGQSVAQNLKIEVKPVDSTSSLQQLSKTEDLSSPSSATIGLSPSQNSLTPDKGDLLDQGKRKYSSFIGEPTTPSITPGKPHKSSESEALSKRAKLCTVNGKVH